jgi:hypothetical protein
MFFILFLPIYFDGINYLVAGTSLVGTLISLEVLLFIINPSTLVCGMAFLI